MYFRWNFELIYKWWKTDQFGNPAISANTRLSSGNVKVVGDEDVCSQTIIAYLYKLLIFLL